jgi:hypothetical protein
VFTAVTRNISGNTATTSDFSCAAGKFLLSGGARVSAGANAPTISEQYPISNTTYRVISQSGGNQNATHTIAANLICTP